MSSMLDKGIILARAGAIPGIFKRCSCGSVSSLRCNRCSAWRSMDSRSRRCKYGTFAREPLTASANVTNDPLGAAGEERYRAFLENVMEPLEAVISEHLSLIHI